MNNITAVSMAKGTTGRPIQLRSWNRNDPVEARIYENRRLEQATRAFRPQVVVRRNNSAVTAAEKQCIWGAQ